MSPPFQINDWRQAAADARRTLEASIPEAWRLPSDLKIVAEEGKLPPEDPRVLRCGILDALDLEITSIRDVEQLRSSFASGKYTAVQVATAFCKRAAIAHQCTSCLTCFFPEQAIQRARDLDAHREQHGTVTGPMHGIPVSLKDMFDIAGQPTTLGLVSWLPNIASKNSDVADAILAAGGILYAKTGCSQACLMVESINNIFGAIRNPYNLSLSVGGSTGGEGALIASKGSIIGSGTDGGGSLRFPAMFCGLWALKCSKGRLSCRGLGLMIDGNESVNAGLGPLAKTVSGLEWWMRIQLATEPWKVDPGCVPMAWGIQEAHLPTSKLVIAVLRDDGVVAPTKPVRRALEQVASALVAGGHRVVELPAEKLKTLHRRGTACVMKSNVQNGGRGVMKHIQASGEPVVPRTATGSSDSLLTTEEVFANHIERGQIAYEYATLWQEYGMDAILTPAVAHPAPPHGKYISNSYATIYNMLDYTTGSIPVTTVSRDDSPEREWLDQTPYPRVEPVRFPYDLGDNEMKELFTSAEVFENAPVGVQIVCQRLREEKCIGVMKEIERLLEFSS
ncbi:phosphoribosylamine-glycine ligase [Fonsecaea monophora]|uniref:Phosphoribosylamine-glycine ligase n=1 Tax=Fonsecaea monophora TaxID=254056 RepID=A0A177EW61_9EURO|nr:phosphoribosylamine-glycine ligase [Fonsecaea monophora]OAG35292.1 phosphoribosylamine-glycine ligase [Fonsecaea monophora]